MDVCRLWCLPRQHFGLPQLELLQKPVLRIMPTNDFFKSAKFAYACCTSQEFRSSNAQIIPQQTATHFFIFLVNDIMLDFINMHFRIRKRQQLPTPSLNFWNGFRGNSFLPWAQLAAPNGNSDSKSQAQLCIDHWSSSLMLMIECNVPTGLAHHRVARKAST